MFAKTNIGTNLTSGYIWLGIISTILFVMLSPSPPFSLDTCGWYKKVLCTIVLSWWSRAQKSFAVIFTSSEAACSWAECNCGWVASLQLAQVPLNMCWLYFLPWFFLLYIAWQLLCVLNKWWLQIGFRGSFVMFSVWGIEPRVLHVNARGAAPLSHTPSHLLLLFYIFGSVSLIFTF